MKKLFATAIAFITLTCCLQAQQKDFRGFAWGSSAEKVKAEEKASFGFKVNNDELSYQDNIGGSACDVIYIFNDNDKLTSGLYVFTKKYSNPQLYVQDYNKFKMLLAQKYGKAESENEQWKTPRTTMEKTNLGQAIADGNLTLNASWTTDRTAIKIILSTNGGHPNLQIHYTTRSLDELEDKGELKNALIKL